MCHQGRQVSSSFGLIDSVTWESKEFRYPDGNAIGTLYYLTTLNVQAE